MSEHRWQGYTHQELYDQISQGPGPDGSSDSVRRWRELTRTLTEVDEGIAGALSAAMADWQGDAADNTRAGLRPLGNWATLATETAELMRHRAERQAELVSKARADMPPPVTVTAEEPPAAASALIHLFGGQSDYEAQEARQDAAEQRAFEVMRTYETSTDANTTSLASFTAPPQVVVDAPAGAGSPAGGQPPITLSWSTPPPTSGPPSGRETGRSAGYSGTSNGGTSNGGTNNGSTNQRQGPASGGSRPSSSDPGRSPSNGGSLTRGSARHGVSRKEQADGEHREVTEQIGSDGFFDEPQTLSKPVIGD